MKFRNRLLIFAASLVPMLAMTSCEEKESPIRFTTAANSAPENISYRYFSPDPCCIGKLHWIDADVDEGDLVLQCTTHDKIAIANKLASPSGLETNTYCSEKGAWTASITDGYVLNIHFDKLDVKKDKDLDEFYISDNLGIVAFTNKGLLSVNIGINRVLIDKSK